MATPAQHDSRPSGYLAVKASAVSQSGTGAPRRYLVGVQGLRTVAALLVAVYHIWFGRVSGGVDVFFVVAGYFAVGSLYRSFHRSTSFRDLALRLRDYLLRTARRVIPSAVVVILGTIMIAALWMPRSAQRAALGSAWASVGFFENWQLIGAATDYAQQDDAASPFQQFWALAVNVQFYILFALATWLIVTLVRARHGSDRDPRRALIVLSGTIFVVSFAYSVYTTETNQPAAYFNTFARLWEFMAGALLFLLMRREFRSRQTAKILGWLGLLTLLLLGAFLDLSRLLPGYLSLIPVLAALGIITSSWNRVEPKPLTWKPVLVIADSSFAFYLWHWPLLVAYRYQFGSEVSLLGGLGIIVLALVLAVATTKLIEDPLRKSKVLTRSWRATLMVLVLLLALPAMAITFWTGQLDRRDALDVAAAAKLSDQITITDLGELTPANSNDDLVPHPSIAKDDFYRRVVEEGCVQEITKPEVLTCEWGDEDSDLTVAVVGGSHSQQWVEVAERAAEEADARLLTYIKSSCLFSSDVDSEFELDSTCAEWNEEVMQSLLDEDVDLVVTMGTRARMSGEWIPDGYTKAFETLSAAGVQVLGLRDNPAGGNLAPVCLESNPLEKCAISKADFYRPFEDLDVPQIEGVTFMDLADIYCEGDMCRANDGVVTMYRDSHHLTSTWVQLRGDVVAEQITRLLEGVRSSRG
ncbi:acyltransferase family protein [Actinomyces minihominis]|uniref:acyltransferase family protein n=1 Tax=Actinomyces minihominis TaxID=2002838 RepID=UPI000C075BA4|nr:acyltransferase family protein [Actinomyces minihominis]